MEDNDCDALQCSGCHQKLPIASFSRSQRKKQRHGCLYCFCHDCVVQNQNEHSRNSSSRQRQIPFSGLPGTTLSPKRRAWISTFVSSHWSIGPASRTCGWPKGKRKPRPEKHECSKCHQLKFKICFDRNRWKNRKYRDDIICHSCDPRWHERPMPTRNRRTSSGRDRCRRKRRVPLLNEFELDFKL